jgi:hypothetical protein
VGVVSGLFVTGVLPPSRSTVLNPAHPARSKHSALIISALLRVFEEKLLKAAPFLWTVVVILDHRPQPKSVCVTSLRRLLKKPERRVGT